MVSRTDSKVIAENSLSSLARVQIEENSWNDNNLFLQTGAEKVETIVDALGERREI